MDFISQDIWRKVAVSLVLLVVVLAAVSGVVGTLAVTNQGNAACYDFTVLRGAITTSIQRSTAALPSITYYKQHPDELMRAQMENQQELELFRSLQC